MESLKRDSTISSDDDEERSFSLWQLVSDVMWYDITSKDMEVVADLFHASFVVTRQQVDEDFTSV